MRSRVILGLLAILLLGVYACKSVETTSAMLHNQTQNYDKAIEMATIAIEKKPDDAEAHFQLGVSYSYKGEMAKAYYHFQKSFQLDPKKKAIAEDNIASNWAKHFNLGVNEFQSENLEGAALEFADATRADPRKIKGWLNLATAYSTLALEDSTYLEPAFEAADTLMAKVKDDDPDFGKVLALAGKIKIMRGDREEAVAIFERLLLDDPTNAEIIEGVGNDFLDIQDYEAAAEFYRMAAGGYRQTETDNALLYFNLGVCYFKVENYMSAAEAFQQYVILEPENVDANYYLLLSYYEGEFWDEAIMQGQKYIELAPNDPRGFQILSLVYSKKNMKLKAEEMAERFQALVGGD